MAHGGRREGAGRKKGSHDKFAVEAAQKAAAEGIMPLDYMLDVLRDKDETRVVRLDAAKAAAPYVHAKLSAVTVGGQVDSDVTHHAGSLPPALAFLAQHSAEGKGRPHPASS